MWIAFKNIQSVDKGVDEKVLMLSLVISCEPNLSLN
jgi:hypothetical protein